MRFLRTLRMLLGMLAVIFIGITVWLFLVFPRLANMLADLLGTNPEEPAHWLAAIVITLILGILAYFWIWLPFRRFREALHGAGLVVQKGQGRAFMDTESVRQQIYAAVTKIHDIQRTEVTVTNDLGRAIVQLNILTDNNINGPKKKQEISREVSKVVQDQLGIQLANAPTINLSLVPIGGEIPQAAPAVAPQVTRSPSSPRTFTPEPAPLPKREPEAVVTPPPAQVETSTTPTAEEVVSQPVDSPRPFTRRPFTPPAPGPLPDLPKPPEKKTPEPDANDTLPLADEKEADTTSESTPGEEDDMPKLDQITGANP